MLENPDPSIVPIGTPDMGRPYRLGVLTGVGKDSALTQILAGGWATLRNALAPNINLQMVWMGAVQEDKAAIEHHGFTVRPYTTAPIGGAWNAGLGTLKEMGVDAVLFMEPNGIVDQGMVRRYVELLLDAYFSIALFDSYLIHPETGKAVFWTGHIGVQKGKPLMTGRCLSRPWLEQAEWAPWPPQATTLERPFIKRLDQLGARADAAGEYRTCGCRGWQFYPIVLRDGTPEGFFDQEGEAAEAQQTSVEALLDSHEAPAFAAALLAYRAGQSEVQPLPSDPPVEVTPEPPKAQNAAAPPLEPAEAVAKWMAEGEAAFADQRLPDAEKCFRRALAINPLAAEVLNNLAVARHAQGDSAGAERLLLKAIVFDLDAVDPFISLTAIAQADERLGLALRYAIGGLERSTHPELLAMTRDLADKTGNADLMAELDALLATTATEVNP